LLDLSFLNNQSTLYTTIMAPIKVGLMGYGFSTNCFHVPYILPNPDLEIYAFLQRKEAPQDKTESGKHCTIDHPNAKHYRTADDFFADSDIELVVVCTAVASHAEYAEKALRSGKHVVVEKPFTQTSEEANHLIAVAKETGKILTVFQNRRYDSDFRTLAKLVKQKAFGKVTEFENHYDVDNPPWLRPNPNPGPGDGMLFGLGTHSFDQTILLFGPPKSVTATTRTLKEGSKSNDTFIALLQYDGEQKDLLVLVKTTIVSPVPGYKQPKYIIRGTHGAFFKSGEDVQVDHFYSGVKVTDEKFGVEPENYFGYLSTVEGSPVGKHDGTWKSEKGSYQDYYVDVVKAIKGGEVAVKPEESRDGLRVIEAAVESAEKGVTVQFSL
jgi:predicted dehydrogenase